MDQKLALKLVGILAVLAVSASAVASPAKWELTAFASLAKADSVLAGGKQVAAADGFQGLGSSDPTFNTVDVDKSEKLALVLRPSTSGKLTIGTDEVDGWSTVAAVLGVSDYIEGWLSVGGANEERERPMVHLPVPAVGWLFGSALIGFISLSNRRKV